MPDLWMDVDTPLSEVPVNIHALTDDIDFKSRETGVTYDQAGMDLVWCFTTTGGATSQTAVTPTTAGNYDWVHQGKGMYTIEIPPVGGAFINNNTEGFGWFEGYATGILPWRGPIIGFRAAALNDALIDDAYSATRGLAGTALPAAVADAAGGLAVSDAGGLDLDNDVANQLIAINLDHLLKVVTAAADMTAEVVDNTILSRMLANGDTSAFVPSTDGLQLIRDAITASAPLAFHPDSSSAVTTGAQGGTTYADAAADGGSKWTIGDEDEAGESTIEVICEFNMGANRVATEVDVNGYFNRSGGGGYVVQVQAYNYTTSGYVTISSASATEEMQDASGDRDYTWPLGIAFTDHVTTPGEVKIKFISTRGTTAGGDVLYLDHVQVDGVASGSTSLEAFASAVWEHVISSTAHSESAGHHLHTLQALITDVATGDTATSFTLSAGVAVNDAYNGMVIMVRDATDGHYEARRVEDYTSGLVVTVDRAFGFTPASGDDVHIMATGYTEVRRGTDGANTTVPDAAGVAAALHATTDALIGALENLSSGEAETAVAAALTAIWLTAVNVGKMLAYAAGETSRNAGTGAETYKNPADSDATTHTLTPDAAGRSKS